MFNHDTLSRDCGKVWSSFKEQQEGTLQLHIRSIKHVTTRMFAENHRSVLVMKSTSTSDQHATFTSTSARAWAWKEYEKLMKCTCRKFKFEWAQYHTLVVNKDVILARVTASNMISVQKSLKDANPATGTENGSLTKIASKFDHQTKEAKQCGSWKVVEGFRASHIWRHSQRPEGMPHVVC